MIEEKRFTVSTSSLSGYEKTPAQFSEAHELITQLSAAINQNNSQELQKILSEDFIYGGYGLRQEDLQVLQETGRLTCDNIAKTKKTSSHYSGNEIGHDEFTMEYEYYLTQPVIEFLFKEHPEKFAKLVQLLDNSNNENLNLIFVNCLKNSAMTDILAAWDVTAQQEIKKKITEMDAYGKKLQQKNVDRGNVAVNLARQLNAKVGYCPQNNDNPTSQIKWLHFKFSFLDTLHSKDQEFKEHRGWKRVIANIASIIFSAGILNLIHYAVTDRILFFDRTTTQELVDNLDHSSRCYFRKGK